MTTLPFDPHGTSDILELTTATTVAASATITFAYPAGKSAASYKAAGAKLYVGAPFQALHTGLTATLSTNPTVDYPASKPTIPAGTKVYLELQRVGTGEAIGNLTIAAGTASTTTTTDVGGSFNQTTLNNQIATLATVLNKILNRLRELGLIAAS